MLNLIGNKKYRIYIKAISLMIAFVFVFENIGYSFSDSQQNKANLRPPMALSEKNKEEFGARVKGGLCVTGDTLLLILALNEGGVADFSLRSHGRELKFATPQPTSIVNVKPGNYVLSLNEETQKIEPHRINALLDMGIKPVYRLTTASGRTIKTTANHPYLVKIQDSLKAGFQHDGINPLGFHNGKWVKVSELSVGQEIAVPQVSMAGILWDKIVSIQYCGYEHVYDIEVEGTHNFIGNSIFAHNTAANKADAKSRILHFPAPIKQDSDAYAIEIERDGLRDTTAIMNAVKSENERKRIGAIAINMADTAFRLNVDWKILSNREPDGSYGTLLSKAFEAIARGNKEPREAIPLLLVKAISQLKKIDTAYAEKLLDILKEKPELVIALLDKSPNLRENCKADGFIGINKVLFHAYKTGQISDKTFLIGLTIAILHELSHEAFPELSEEDRLEKDTMLTNILCQVFGLSISTYISELQIIIREESYLSKLKIALSMYTAAVKTKRKQRNASRQRSKATEDLFEAGIIPNILLALRDMDELYAKLQGLKETKFITSNIKISYAKLLAWQGRIGEARRLASNKLDMPGILRAYFSYHLGKEDVPSALKVAEECILKFPKSWEVQSAYFVKELLDNRHIDEAHSILNRLYDLKAELSPNRLLEIACLYQELDDWPIALEICKRMPLELRFTKEGSPELQAPITALIITERAKKLIAQDKVDAAIAIAYESGFEPYRLVILAKIAPLLISSHDVYYQEKGKRIIDELKKNEVVEMLEDKGIREHEKYSYPYYYYKYMEGVWAEAMLAADMCEPVARVVLDDYSQLFALDSILEQVGYDGRIDKLIQVIIEASAGSKLPSFGFRQLSRLEFTCDVCRSLLDWVYKHGDRKTADFINRYLDSIEPQKKDKNREDWIRAKLTASVYLGKDIFALEEEFMQITKQNSFLDNLKGSATGTKESFPASLRQIPSNSFYENKFERMISRKEEFYLRDTYELKQIHLSIREPADGGNQYKIKTKEQFSNLVKIVADFAMPNLWILSDKVVKVFNFLVENNLLAIRSNGFIVREIMDANSDNVAKIKSLLEGLLVAFKEENNKIEVSHQYDERLFIDKFIPIAYVLEFLLPGSIKQMIGLLKSSGNPQVLVRFLELKKEALLNGDITEALYRFIFRVKTRLGNAEKLEISKFFKIIDISNSFVLLYGTKDLIQELDRFYDSGNIDELYNRLTAKMFTSLARAVGIEDIQTDIGIFEKIYMPFIGRLVKAMDKIKKDTPNKMPRFKGLLRAMLKDRFWEFIEDTAQSDETGKAIAQHNKNVRKEIKKLGIDIEKWIGRNEEHRMESGEFIYYEKTSYEYDPVADTKTLIDYLIRTLNIELDGLQINNLLMYLKSIGIVPEYGKDRKVVKLGIDREGQKKKDIIKILSDEENLAKLSNLTEELLLSEYATHISETISHLKEKIGMLRERLKLGYYQVELGKMRKSFTIRPILRNPGRDLFIGDFTDCCLAMNSNLYPDAMVDRLIDEAINVIEVIDNATGETMACAWLFIAEDGSLVIQNLEINAGYETIIPVRDRVGEGMVEYIEEFAAYIGAKRLVIGMPGHGKYFGEGSFIKQRYKTVPFNKDKAGGYFEGIKYYLDSAGKSEAYLVTGITKAKTKIIKKDFSAINSKGPYESPGEMIEVIEDIKAKHEDLSESQKGEVRGILGHLRTKVHNPAVPIDADVKEKILSQIQELLDKIENNIFITYTPSIGIRSPTKYVISAVLSDKKTIALIDGFFNSPNLTSNKDYQAEILLHEILAIIYPEKSHTDHKARYESEDTFPTELKQLIENEKLIGIQRKIFRSENPLKEAIRAYMRDALFSMLKSATGKLKAVIEDALKPQKNTSQIRERYFKAITELGKIDNLAKVILEHTIGNKISPLLGKDIVGSEIIESSTGALKKINKRLEELQEVQFLEQAHNLLILIYLEVNLLDKRVIKAAEDLGYKNIEEIREFLGNLGKEFEFTVVEGKVVLKIRQGEGWIQVEVGLKDNDNLAKIKAKISYSQAAAYSIEIYDTEDEQRLENVLAEIERFRDGIFSKDDVEKRAESGIVLDYMIQQIRLAYQNYNINRRLRLKEHRGEVLKVIIARHPDSNAIVGFRVALPGLIGFPSSDCYIAPEWRKNNFGIHDALLVKLLEEVLNDRDIIGISFHITTKAGLMATRSVLRRLGIPENEVIGTVQQGNTVLLKRESLERLRQRLGGDGFAKTLLRWLRQSTANGTKFLQIDQSL